MQKFTRVLSAALVAGALLTGAAFAEGSCCSNGDKAGKSCCHQGVKGGWFTGAGTTAAAKPACCDAEKAKGGDAKAGDKDKSCCEKAGANTAAPASCCEGEKK